MRVDVDAVCRKVLARGAGESDLEDAVRRACEELCSDGPGAVHVVLRMIDLHAEQTGASRLEAVRRMAQGEASAETHTWTSTNDDMPPEIRARMARVLERGEDVRHVFGSDAVLLDEGS